MQYDENDSLLVAAFKVVAEYDPATYARMQASKWVVSQDIREAMPEAWTEAIQDQNIVTSFGVTLSDESAGYRVSQAETWIVPWMVGAWTEANDIDQPELFVADVLVHEFAHIHADDNHKHGNEHDASVAGLEFAHLLSGRDGSLITDLAVQHYLQVGDGE